MVEIKNRKAYFDYEIMEEIEAGIVLTGTEIKSIRNGNVNLKDSYAIIRNNEIFLINTHILSCEMIAIFIILYIILNCSKMEKYEVWISFLIAGIGTFVLNAKFIIPFLDCMMKGNTVVTDSSRNLFSLNDRGVFISQFFNLFPAGHGINQSINDGIANENPYIRQHKHTRYTLSL